MVPYRFIHKMHMHLMAVFLMQISLPYILPHETSYTTEELVVVFGRKGCIEASNIVLPSGEQQKNILLEKDSVNSFFSYITSNVTLQTSEAENKNVLSALNDVAAHNQVSFEYELVSEKGPAHNKTFTIALKLGSETFEASASSQKKAKRSVALKALQNTKYAIPEERKKNAENTVATPTVLLNNVAAKLGIPVSYFLIGDQEIQLTSTKHHKIGTNYSEKLNKSIHDSSAALHVPDMPPNTGPFSVKVKVGDSVYIGLGHTVKAARHDAASRALKEMEKQTLLEQNVCTIDESSDECKQKRAKLKSPVSRVYEVGQANNLAVAFNVISETGKAHQKKFVTECVLGTFRTQGEGTSKKESKREAAQRMANEYLPSLPETYSQTLISGKTKKRRKKNKIERNVAENDDSNKSVGDMISSMLSLPTDENQQQSDEISGDGHQKKTHDSNSKSPKTSILSIGDLMGIDVQFSDLKKIGDKYYSLMSLGVEPLHICLGNDLCRDLAQDKAAAHGLGLLHRNGFLEDPKYSSYKKEIMDAIAIYNVHAIELPLPADSKDS